MDKKIYSSLIENATLNVRTWQRVTACVLISNLILVIYLVSADRSEKTIVVPPGLKEEFWIKGNEVSPLYIEQMAKYFFQLLLTYNKKNVQGQYNDFLHYMRPEKYGAMKAVLMSDVDRITRNELGSAFYPMKSTVSKMRAEVEGEQVGIVGDKVVSRKIKKYFMLFNYQNGNLTIEAYSEVGQ
ncbi:MAG: type IV conjugative transfer system protein TraE [Oligoflexia bacterium]|nr:type IV conjugative transfer system protein TraE [Oligoflexia bacterium]